MPKYKKGTMKKKSSATDVYRAMHGKVQGGKKTIKKRK